MELPPFNYPNPLGLFGGAKQASYWWFWQSTLSHFVRIAREKINQQIFDESALIKNSLKNSHLNLAFQIRAEAAYLYDAVHLYTRALIQVLESKENPRNGTAIINSLKGNSYLSAMG